MSRERIALRSLLLLTGMCVGSFPLPAAWGQESDNAFDQATADTKGSTSLPAVRPKTQEEIDAEVRAELEAYERRLREVADAYGPPDGGKQLSKQPDLWIDRENKRIYLDGYVALRRGQIEMLACPVGTKEHESIIAAFASSKEVHAALLALGTQSGTPVRFQPSFLPPTGQAIRIWIMWYDEKGDFQVVDAREWIQNVQTNQSMKPDWVFAGSGFWKDPESGTEHYMADSGDMICVSNFSTSMLDVPMESSAQEADLMFMPFTDRIPKSDTPVRLVLAPIPNPTDAAETEADRAFDVQPTAKALPASPIDGKDG
ncbi:MAG: YdjY domain-containing protein [Planctomycetota bacterium]